jgi:hypothetical protein
MEEEVRIANVEVGIEPLVVIHVEITKTIVGPPKV